MLLLWRVPVEWFESFGFVVVVVVEVVVVVVVRVGFVVGGLGNYY